MYKVHYANAVDSVMYIMVCIGPDLAFAISVLRRFLSNPCECHCESMKWLLRHLNGIVNLGLIFNKGKIGIKLKEFVDSNFVGNNDNRKIYICICFYFI